MSRKDAAIEIKAAFDGANINFGNLRNPSGCASNNGLKATLKMINARMASGLIHPLKIHTVGQICGHSFADKVKFEKVGKTFQIAIAGNK